MAQIFKMCLLLCVHRGLQAVCLSGTGALRASYNTLVLQKQPDLCETSIMQLVEAALRFLGKLPHLLFAVILFNILKWIIFSVLIRFCSKFETDLLLHGKLLTGVVTAEVISAAIWMV